MDNQGTDNQIESKIGEKLAPFNPSSDTVIEIAMSFLELKPNDIIYDLGCGDARFLIKAAQSVPTLKAIGVEYDYDVYVRACELVANNLLQEKISILHDNVLNIDFSEATVIFVYLVPEGMKRLKDKLYNAIEKGVRIVTYVFSIPGLDPVKVETYKSSTKIYLYKKIA